jgi:hypothetical protein
MALLIFVVGSVLTVRADDLYVIDMRAVGARLPAPDTCNAFLWDADTVFYNLGASDASVALVGVSNGSIQPGIRTTFPLPAGRATSIREAMGTAWSPTSTGGIWLYHLNVPAGVRVESGMLLSLTNPFCTTPGFISQPYGKAALPVFRSLVPTGQQQVLTGLTLGDIAAHINVGIYNGGNDAASATVEIHRACDGALVDTRTVSLQPNSLQQFGGFAVSDTPAACTQAFSGPNGLNHAAYAVVTVDQPSVSFASTVANAQLPTTTIQVTGAQQ